MRGRCWRKSASDDGRSTLRAARGGLAFDTRRKATRGLSGSNTWPPPTRRPDGRAGGSIAVVAGCTLDLDLDVRHLAPECRCGRRGRPNRLEYWTTEVCVFWKQSVGELGGRNESND